MGESLRTIKDFVVGEVVQGFVILSVNKSMYDIEEGLFNWVGNNPQVYYNLHRWL